MIKELEIHGLRSFASPQRISFSLPDGYRFGSGLNIISGSNNAGKTTIIEAIEAFNSDMQPTFSEGIRNKHSDERVTLKLIDEHNESYMIATTRGGGVLTDVSKLKAQQSYILQSRRSYNSEFFRIEADREFYISHYLGNNSIREPLLNSFSVRIFQIEKNKDEFDALFSRILGNCVLWHLEQYVNGSYYIKFKEKEIAHSAEGIGDGIWSVFTICAALFDAPMGSTIVIDEPELSLHPAIQKRLSDLFFEYSKDLQIILCTHSPYFINWDAINNDGQIIRVAKENSATYCYSIEKENKHRITNFITDLNNPHILGINANEVFFLEDNIILVEGQEDVVIYKKMLKDFGMHANGEFFGWGVGGADKVDIFLTMFRDLGYKNIAVILDGDRRNEIESLKSKYIGYYFVAISKDDVRDKEERTIKGKIGLATRQGRCKTENVDEVKAIFKQINVFFDGH